MWRVTYSCGHGMTLHTCSVLSLLRPDLGFLPCSVVSWVLCDTTLAALSMSALSVRNSLRLMGLVWALGLPVGG